MSTATLQPAAEISLFPSRESAQAQWARLLAHPHNRVAVGHLEFLEQEALPNYSPVVLLAQWAVENRPDECTYRHPAEAEIALADWQCTPEAAVEWVKENVRLDDFAQMSPEEAASSLMLMFTVH